MYGDVDGNGKITSDDALAVLKHVVKLKTLTPEEGKAADVDGNKEITADDALWILKKIVKVTEVFPVEKIK